MKHYVAGKQYYEEGWLLEIGSSRVSTIAEADLVLFNGGADVSTSFYNQEKSKRTQMPDVDRDYLEKAEFEEAQRLGKYCVGVCRGSQIICILSGGSLIQDVKRHAIGLPGHPYYDIKNNAHRIGSWHHQMMYPFDVKGHKIIGVAPITLLDHHGEDGKKFQYPKNFMEVETCLFTRTKSLGIQTHPDWLEGPTRKMFQDYVLELLETGNISGNARYVNRHKIENTYEIQK